MAHGVERGGLGVVWMLKREVKIKKGGNVLRRRL
jgi:hypothetical protein